MKITKLLSTFVILLSVTLTAQAEVPKLINYQGKLTAPHGGCFDTTVQMTFSIYSDTISVDPLWTETQPSVKVKEGVFNILLGSVDSIPESVFAGDIRYLGVKVGDDAEMTPRKAIVSVGYAFRSEYTDTAEHALSAPPDDDWDTDTSGLNIYRFTGNVGVGEMPQDSCKLFVQSDSMVGDYAIYARGGTGLKAIATAWEGTGIEGEGGHAGVAGNGYIGILGQGFWGGWFNGKGYFSGNVGIGTTEPDENLEVDGNAHITGDLTVDGSINSIRLKAYDSGWFSVGLNTTYTKTHNLGTTKVLVSVYVSDTDDNSGWVITDWSISGGQGADQAMVVKLTATQIAIRTTSPYLCLFRDENGTLHSPASGYARVIMLALE